MPDHDVLGIGAGIGGTAGRTCRCGQGFRWRNHSARSTLSARTPTPTRGGINVELQEDEAGSRSFDTIKGSDYLADQDAVEICAGRRPTSCSTSSNSGDFQRNEEGKAGDARPSAGHRRTDLHFADINRPGRSCTSSTSS